MINKWQADWREEIERIGALHGVKIDEGRPSAFKASYVYLSRAAIEALLNGNSVSFYDGEYSHHLLMLEVETEVNDGETDNAS